MFILFICMVSGSCSKSDVKDHSDDDIYGGHRSYTDAHASKVTLPKEVSSFDYGFNSEGLVYLDNMISQNYCSFSLENQDEGTSI